MNTIYTTKGDVCGTCHHEHRTIKGALLCARKHDRTVKDANPGGSSYSDRAVVHSDWSPLTDDEQAEAMRVLDGIVQS